jgi:hypothetical protein
MNPVSKLFSLGDLIHLVLFDTSYPNPMGCLTFRYQKSISLGYHSFADGLLGGTV